MNRCTLASLTKKYWVLTCQSWFAGCLDNLCSGRLMIWPESFLNLRGELASVFQKECSLDWQSNLLDSPWLLPCQCLVFVVHTSLGWNIPTMTMLFCIALHCAKCSAETTHYVQTKNLLIQTADTHTHIKLKFFQIPLVQYVCYFTNHKSKSVAIRQL